VDLSDDVVTHACVAAGLLQLLRESAKGEYRAFWWLPLNLLARCGISRSEFVGAPAQDLATDLIGMVYAGVLGVRPTEGSKEDQDALAKGLGNPHIQRHRHWKVQSVLQARLLSRLKRIHPQRHANELSKIRLVDAWCAWRVAREWAKREGKA